MFIKISLARARLFHILHKPSPDSFYARWVNYGLAFLIVINAVLVSLETISSLTVRYGQTFKLIEAISTGIFIVEYLLRSWVCVEQSRYAHPVNGRVSYALHLLPILDLIAIVTFWLPIDLRFVRVVRMVRLLKVLRLERFEESLARITAGLQKRSAFIVLAITMMLISIYAAAALIYQLEHRAQPDVFTSIPATFWWAIETLTTIGYGDMVPKTALGKLCAGVISVFGIGIFALPTAIITAVIVEAGASDHKAAKCKHCGGLNDFHH